MNLRSLFLFVGLVLMVGIARAQVGVYGMVTGERATGFTCVDPQNRCASNDGTERPYGGTFGAQYDFRHMGPALLGFDVRGGVLNTNKSATTYSTSKDLIRQYTLLGGVRASFNAPLKLHPYIEAAGGYAKYANISGTQFEGVAGVDLALFSVIDIRLIELSAGEVIAGGNHPFQTIGIGLVFHKSR